MCGCVVYVRSGGQAGPGQIDLAAEAREALCICVHACDSLSDTGEETLIVLLF